MADDRGKEGQDKGFVVKDRRFGAREEEEKAPAKDAGKTAEPEAEGTSDRDDKGHGYVIGPSIVGKSGPREVPYSFGVNLHLEVDTDRQSTTRVRLQSGDKIIANVHCSKPKEVPPFKWVDSTEPEEIRAFWKWIQSVRS